MKLPEPRYKVTDNNHRYTIALPNGQTVGPLVSVTGVCGILDKPALIGWAARESAAYFKTELLRLGFKNITPEVLDQLEAEAKGAHRRKAKDAADLGTACHNIFEAILKGQAPESVPPELVEPAKDFKRWRMSTDIEIVAMELAVGSVNHKYGGRIDAIGYSKKRGGWGIVDYKTSSGFYGNEYAYQVGGYAWAFNEMFGVPVQWADIVRFGKKPPYDSEARSITNIGTAAETFIYMRRVKESESQELISPPHFSTTGARQAEEQAKAPKKTRKEIDSPVGF